MSEKELLRCALDLINAIEKNAGLPALIDMSAGTGMSHLGYAHFKNEAESALNARNELLASLELVMSWIDNWSPNFTEDPEWPADNAKIRAAIKAKGGQP